MSATISLLKEPKHHLTTSFQKHRSTYQNNQNLIVFYQNNQNQHFVKFTAHLTALTDY